MVTLRVGSRVALPGAGAGCGGGDAVPDGDFLGADEDVLGEQPQDALAFFDGGGGGVAVQLGEEAFQSTDPERPGVVGQSHGGTAKDVDVRYDAAARETIAEPAESILNGGSVKQRIRLC